MRFVNYQRIILAQQRVIPEFRKQDKLIKGLFFAGEIIDCDAYTGGFNLQIAWSSAYAAANGTKNIDKSHGV